MTVPSSLIIVFVSLILFAGIIAYVGDILGTVIGKRRLSLFGVRPKQTGRLIGVLAGILIMLMTIGTLLLTQENLRKQIFQANALLTLTRQQEQELNLIQRGLETAQQELEANKRELESVQQQAQEIAQNNTALIQDNERLTVLNADLQKQAEEAVGLQNINLRLQAQLNEGTNRLTILQDQIAALEERRITYQQWQIIHTETIDAQSPEGIREALRQFMVSANNKVILRGSPGIQGLSTDDTQFLVEAIAVTEESDILTFYSDKDQFLATEVTYNRDLVENVKIMDEGQLVSSRRVHMGSSEAPVTRENVTAELARLSTAARSSLLRRNLITDASIEPAGLTTNSFTEQLLSLRGPVTIGVIANEDVYAAGPVRLEFAILY